MEKTPKEWTKEQQIAWQKKIIRDEYIDKKVSK